MAKFDPFLSLDCARVEGVGAQSKERKGSNFAAQLSGAIVQKPEGPNTYNIKNLARAIWQPWLFPHPNTLNKSAALSRTRTDLRQTIAYCRSCELVQRSEWKERKECISYFTQIFTYARVSKQVQR